MSDLLLIAPDKAWHSVLRQVLDRPLSLGIRPIDFEVVVHPGRDAGVRSRGPELAAELSRYHYRAILILDHEGCGDARSAELIEQDLRERLRRHWADRADVVVVTPELEAWLCRAVAQLSRILDMPARDLRDRLVAPGPVAGGTTKPERPKETFEELFRSKRKIPSAAVYAGIARQASLRREGCLTQSFPRFVDILRGWFPPSSPTPT